MFRFRLEKVLRHRQRQVEAEARVLRLRAAAWAAVRREQAQLQSEVARVSELGARQRLLCAGLPQWRMLAEYLAHLRERQLWLVAREREAASAHAAQRQRLLQAHRDQEVLERLRDRQRSQWDDAERRREQRRLDDIAGRGREGELQTVP